MNILSKEDTRCGRGVEACDLITISDDGRIVIPDNVDGAWTPQSVAPIEIIDGQHRLWAFDGLDCDFELPVVAFYGLDISWQAYLFWSINIMPKKINPSLAFDLYPLLRAQDWLEGFSGPIVYREARAQEIVEILWSSMESPWYHRINMLGDRGVKAQVSQAAWIRALLSSYVKAWKSPERQLGGFYGVLAEGDEVIPWTLEHQAMFLVYLGNQLKSAISSGNSLDWVKAVTNGTLREVVPNAAFESEDCMLNHDQGIRGVLDVTNSVFCALYGKLKDEYLAVGDINAMNYTSYTVDLEQLAPKLCNVVKAIADKLAQYDWRSFDFDGLTDEERRDRAGFRGSGGYKLIRHDLMLCLGETSDALLKEAVDRVRSVS